MTPVYLSPTTTPEFVIESPSSTHFKMKSPTSGNSHKKLSLAACIELVKQTPLTSVDSWEEFLDRPSGPCVVRAHKNRLARLATAVVGVYRGDRVLAGDNVCGDCCAELHDLGGEEITDRITFIV
jgi:hypothetical protein